MNHFWQGFEKNAGFFGSLRDRLGRFGLGKKAPVAASTSTALVPYVPPLPEILIGKDEANEAILNFVKSKGKRGLVEGGLAGTGLGAGAGYLYEKNRGGEESEKDPFVTTLVGGLVGGLIGAPVGGAVRAAKASKAARPAADTYNEMVQNLLMKDPKGNWQSTPHAENDIFKDKNLRQWVESDELRIPVVNVFGDFKNFLTKEEKVQALDNLILKYDKQIAKQKAKGVDGSELDFDVDDLMAGLRSRMGASEKEKLLKDTVLGHVVEHMDRSPPWKPGIPEILGKLRSEGIHSVKDFAKKYHPDINKKIPEDYKKNFGQIIEALKSQEEGGKVDHFAAFMEGFKRRQADYTARANQAIRNLKG